MTQLDSASLTWYIEDFVNLNSYNGSPDFETKQAKFWLRIYPKDLLPCLKNYIAIYLFRDEPRTTDVEVLWTISLINDKGEECYRKAIETNYTVEGLDDQISGGLYYLDRDTIIKPTISNLLVDYCLVVTIIDDQSTFAKQSIDEQMITLLQKKSFASYESLLESSKYSDVVFVVGKKKFKLHKIILASQSPVFSAMFGADFEEAKQNRVDIIDVDVEVFEAMIRFIYTGKMEALGEHAAELFAAADKICYILNPLSHYSNPFYIHQQYQLDHLKCICEQSLISSLTVESVCGVLLLSDMQNADQLKSKCIQFVIEHAKEVMQTEEWNQLVKSNRIDLVVQLFAKVANKDE